MKSTWITRPCTAARNGGQGEQGRMGILTLPATSPFLPRRAHPSIPIRMREWHRAHRLDTRSTLYIPHRRPHRPVRCDDPTDTLPDLPRRAMGRLAVRTGWCTACNRPVRMTKWVSMTGQCRDCRKGFTQKRKPRHIHIFRSGWREDEWGVCVPVAGRTELYYAGSLNEALASVSAPSISPESWT